VAAIKAFDSIQRASPRSCDLVWVVCAVGIAGLVRDSWPSPVQGHWINLHAAFGASLWALAVARFRQHAHTLGVPPELDFRRLCRQPSRTVYLVLYVVFGAEQVIRAGALLWNCKALGTVHHAVLQPPESLHDFLVYGIIALLTIRALAVLYTASLRRRPDLNDSLPAALQMSQGPERGGAAAGLLTRREPVQSPL
jgi:cytochrome b561